MIVLTPHLKSAAASHHATSPDSISRRRASSLGGRRENSTYLMVETSFRSRIINTAVPVASKVMRIGLSPFAFGYQHANARIRGNDVISFVAVESHHRPVWIGLKGLPIDDCGGFSRCLGDHRSTPGTSTMGSFVHGLLPGSQRCNLAIRAACGLQQCLPQPRPAESLQTTAHSTPVCLPMHTWKAEA